MKVFLINVKQHSVPAIITFVLSVVALIVLSCIKIHTTVYEYNIEVWADACEYLDMFLPLMVVLPFTWRLFYEKKDGFLTYMVMRVAKRQYVFAKIAAGIAVSFVMVFCIYFLSLVCILSFPDVYDPMGVAYLKRYLFGSMQANNPLLFGFFWCLWKGCLGAIICAVGYMFVLVVDNVLIALLAPFVYCIIENFVTSAVELEEYSVYTSIVLNRLVPEYMSISNYYIGIISFVVVCSIIVLMFCCKRKWDELHGKFDQV